MLNNDSRLVMRTKVQAVVNDMSVKKAMLFSSRKNGGMKGGSCTPFAPARLKIR